MSSEKNEHDAKNINRRQLLMAGAAGAAGAAGIAFAVWGKTLNTNSKTGIRTAGITDAQQSELRGIPMESKPNIILMVPDNLGCEAVGYYGDGRFETPRLNAMAAEGVVFDKCLIATPLCSPARCGWNTGRHPYRVGINSQTNYKNPESGLSLDEVSLAWMLRSAGYTTGLFGKWNLGYAEKFNPLHHGFHEFYGSNAGHADYYTHLYNRDMKSHFFRGLEPVADEGYFDTLFTDEAIQFIEQRSKEPAPFYLNLTFYAPHGPYQAPTGYYHSDDPEVNYRYMVEYLDLCVGRVLDAVNRADIAENTLVVFLSDQGGSHINGYGRTLWERSLKVICNAVWPGRIAPNTRSSTPWVHYDLYSTFATLAGAQIPNDRIIDAQNIWPLFEGKDQPLDRRLHWTFRTEDAVREGDLKLHATDGTPDGLFDLSNDPDEKSNLLTTATDKVEDMMAKHHLWKQECEAQQTSKA
jgi:arylsulfatase A-like enzyme